MINGQGTQNWHKGKMVQETMMTKMKKYQIKWNIRKNTGKKKTNGTSPNHCCCVFVLVVHFCFVFVPSLCGFVVYPPFLNALLSCFYLFLGCCLSNCCFCCSFCLLVLLLLSFLLVFSSCFLFFFSSFSVFLVFRSGVGKFLSKTGRGENCGFPR